MRKRAEGVNDPCLREEVVFFLREDKYASSDAYLSSRRKMALNATFFSRTRITSCPLFCIFSGAHFHLGRGQKDHPWSVSLDWLLHLFSIGGQELSAEERGGSWL